MPLIANRTGHGRCTITLSLCSWLSASFFSLQIHAQTAPTHVATPTHEAVVTTLTGTLEVLTSPHHNANATDTITEGQHLRLSEDGNATLTLHNGTTVVMRDRAELFAYGDPSVRPPAGQSPTFDTVLRRGVFRVTAPAASHPVAFSTPACTITVTAGSEVLLRVDPRRTRISVVRGRARIRAMGREVVAREGMGAKVEVMQPAVPHMLVSAPTINAIRSESYTFGGTVSTPLGWTANGRTPAARWRVQVSREATFATVLQEQTVSTTRMSVDALSAGSYFVRVGGTDSDELDGSWSAPATFRVEGPVVTPGRVGHSVAFVSVPAGLPCGLDSSPMRLQPGPMELTPGRNHVLRCDRGESGGGLAEMQISAETAGPLQHQIRITPDATSDTHSLSIRLTDARGFGIPYATIAVTAPAGVRVDPVREGTDRGMYTATVRWPASLGRGALRVTVNGATSFEETLGP